MDRFVLFCEKFLSEHRASIILLIFLVSLTGAIAAYKYYKYSEEEPRFCATCHVMKEPYETWERSRHWQVTCQICHRMGILEKNRLLVAYVVKGKTGPIRQAHGRHEPWRSCKACHLEETSQGAVSLRKSFGHARHVFMEDIGCENCHSGDLHDFGPKEDSCRKCHGDKLIHGLGMEGLSCLRCHTYGPEAPRLVSTERCLRCHPDVPKTGPMAALLCFDCHKPHGQISFTSSDCLGRCHGNEAGVGQHGLHMKKTGLRCLDCHKAHIWVVGKRQAKGLCDRCHPLKDPNSFIY